MAGKSIGASRKSEAEGAAARTSGGAIDHASFSSERGRKGAVETTQVRNGGFSTLALRPWDQLSLLLISCRCGTFLIGYSCCCGPYGGGGVGEQNDKENGLSAAHSVHIAGGLRVFARYRAANSFLHIKR
jgi:hypothetical protein